MKVKYLRDVTYPVAQRGQVDEVRDLPDRTARLLLAGGFVEIVETGTQTEGEDYGNSETPAEDT